MTPTDIAVAAILGILLVGAAVTGHEPTWLRVGMIAAGCWQLGYAAFAWLARRRRRSTHDDLRNPVMKVNEDPSRHVDVPLAILQQARGEPRGGLWGRRRPRPATGREWGQPSPDGPDAEASELTDSDMILPEPPPNTNG